ncbi:hypothetical protein [Fredinandcohnia quinoae]|uniref:Uncharacterized protein n=1 Tax=Fredinandcohnia quinoae TaxID=2918902 RepID=A0AAW5DUY3_9BACI|nr:hypothetical protein [Fredinandcohnia sp. SECRCQ15]MCH1624452.1 hypothetical protein [Fredinandcohnia sp. SECRCQ15]
MRMYKLQEVINLSEDKKLLLKNEKDQEVGFIRREVISGYEEKHIFSYTSMDENNKVIVGIKKRGLTTFLTPRYGVITQEHEYELKDKIGNNILYFCVIGVLENKKILIEENWDGDIEIKVEKQVVAYIRKLKKSDLFAFFQFEDQIKENSLLFSVTILMYFMFKIYNKEAEIIQYIMDWD